MFKIILTTFMMLSLVSPELKAVPSEPPEIPPSMKGVNTPLIYQQVVIYPDGAPPQHVVVQPVSPQNPYILGPSHRMCNLVGRWIGGGLVAATLIYLSLMDHVHH